MRLDITPFAFLSTDAAATILRWEEPRDIHRVVLDFDGPAPRGETILEYRQHHWPANRITEAHLQKGAGGALGWRACDDWFNGVWKKAKILTRRRDSTLAIAFAPLGAVEFPDLAAVYSVAFRQTNQIRLVPPPGAPSITRIQVFTDTSLQRREIHVEANCDGARDGLIPPVWRWEDARVEIYNGVLEELHPPTPDDPRACLRLLCAQPAPFSADGTIVTLRLGAGQKGGVGFSFRPEDLDPPPHRIWAPDLGILLSPAAAKIRYDDGPAARLVAGKPIYDRIAEQPEQSVEQALREMPPKRPMHFVVGCEGRRQKFGVEPNGDLFARGGYVRRVPGADTPRLLWPGDGMRVKLFWDSMLPAGRTLEAGCLPLLRSRYVLRDLEIEQQICATVLGGIDKPIAGDDPVVALVRIAFRNRGDAPLDIDQRIALHTAGIGLAIGWDPPDVPGDDLLVLDGDRVSRAGPPEFAWMVVREEGGDGAGDAKDIKDSKDEKDIRDGRDRTNGARTKEARTNGTLRLSDDRRSVVWSAVVPPGGARSLTLRLPFLSPNETELGQLRGLYFDDEWTAVRRYWMRRVDAGADLRTGVVDIDDFWRAHLTHVLINDEQEPGTRRLMGRVGSHNYGNFSNETVMQVMDLDRRGFHDEARRHYETFLHYQGTAPLPGKFTNHDGVFYGSGGYEQGGYNQHHGWVLWGLAHHYRMTGDRAWLLANADRIARGCDWVLRERDATKRTDASGRRVLEYGFMPVGSLEDVTDYYYWLSTNALTCRGVVAAAEALADAGVPEGTRILREAREFRDDLRAGFEEMRLRAPLVKLRDGSFVPAYPSRLYHRGRDFGWIREVLEGSINLIGSVLDPGEEGATWILKDYEDNRYLDAPFNYPLDNFEAQWFSRGGFSFQPNLWYFPPPYLDRDQIEHFLRALFNGFAACWRADIRAMTEHPLPGLDGWAGDHFKSSDEAMVAFWLRLMFIQESGNDLHIGRGLPRACLAPGKCVHLNRAATEFGPMNVEIATSRDGCAMTADIDPPTRRPPERVFARFRHPDRWRMIAARVNGKAVDTFDAGKEWVVLPPMAKRIHVEAEFRTEPS